MATFTLANLTDVTNPTVQVVTLDAVTAPATPPANTFYLYVDSADNKLKAKGPSGTVTILALP